jgi:hypothetical protein
VPLKTKPDFGQVITDGVSTPISQTYREIIFTNNSKLVDGHYKTLNSCQHGKMITPGYAQYEWGDTYSGSFLEWVFESRGLIYSKAVEGGYLQLDFQENNNFELIPFLADWDATIAMFCKNFLKKLSYGSVTWGILPFISDFKSLLASLGDINDGILKSYDKIIGKRISRRCPFQFEFMHVGMILTVTGSLNYQGYLDGDLSMPSNIFDAALMLLDELGVHPDLKTVWDVIPLSFVADYFLPIGDILETAHPRGWFRPTMRIVGGHSVKCKVSMRAPGGYLDGFGGTYSWYDRRPGLLDLPSRAPVDPKFQTPDLKELFNTLYLGFTSRKR